jgi:glycosyltransferase involved in cell wall biosynthesis
VSDRDDEPMDILYFGNHWFAENRTSSHHLARQLAKRHRVHYFECPGLRAPGGSGRDLKKVFAKLWSFFRGARTVPEGLKVRTLLQLPLHRFALVRLLNRLLVKATVRLVMWREGVRKPVTWFHIPHLPFVVNGVGERLAVYYCIDDYAAFPGVDRHAVRAMDDETARRADVVFIASDTLLEHKQALNDNTYVSPHGVDLDHFARARDPETPIPADVAHIPGRVVGYFGLIADFTDLDLIATLARRRPDWTFVMIGRVAVPPEQVPDLPNVRFLGKRDYDDLPAYGKRFDAAILPYRPGSWSHHANPIKLREYLAMGVPVVSVDTPQMRKFSDVVAVARTPDEFYAALDQVFSSPPDLAAVPRRMARVAGSSWQARAAAVLDQINQELVLTEPAAPESAVV